MGAQPHENGPHSDDLGDAATYIRFAQIAAAESRRTVICHPDNATMLEAILATRGMHHITVQAVPHCPTDRYYIADPQALDAAVAESLQHLARRRFR